MTDPLLKTADKCVVHEGVLNAIGDPYGEVFGMILARIDWRFVTTSVVPKSSTVAK